MTKKNKLKGKNNKKDKVRVKAKERNEGKDKGKGKHKGKSLNLTNGGKKKGLFDKGKLLEKIDMYDMIIANLIAGKSIIEPSQKLDSSEMAIGFSNVASESQITKYFVIKQLPDYLQSQLIDEIRSKCVRNGVRINFMFYCNPYKINWDSAEMRNKMAIWRRYSEETSGDIGVFDYRNKRSASVARDRIIKSTKYLNEAELDHRRSLIRAALVIEVSAKREEEFLVNMTESIQKLKEVCNRSDIVLKELKVNMIDWLKNLGIFSLKKSKEVDDKISRKILTDDILANFSSYRQGKVGLEGIPLGIDVLASGPVLYKFKSDPDKAENWLISATTGGGKSYYLKALLTYMLADGFVVTVMDYEGDEYTNLAAYIRAGNSEDVKVVSMGKGSTVYFDPCEIPDLTGDDEVDDELKENAISYILSVFRVISCGLEGDLSQWEESVLSNAIQRMYDSAGVTEDKETWKRSKGLRLSMIYEEIKEMVDSKELVDSDADNVKHKAALKLENKCSIYFEQGGSKYSTFEKPMSANELFKAKFIVFSFGMKGASSSLNDPTTLALKQLSVAYVSIQISNYCKYVRKCFNVKAWEEYNRWGDAKGSADIISNVMTGGRKRGDINFIITNDLAAILDDNNSLNEKIRQNIQNYAIGKIKDKDVRKKFCEKFELEDIAEDLDRIAKANSLDDKNSNGTYSNKYKYAFCVVMDNGKRSITKVLLPKALRQSSLFATGVDTKGRKGEQ